MLVVHSPPQAEVAVTPATACAPGMCRRRSGSQHLGSVGDQQCGSTWVTARSWTARTGRWDGGLGLHRKGKEGESLVLGFPSALGSFAVLGVFQPQESRAVHGLRLC